ncbi:MAG: PDZ domain-containing protein [Planctomycetota bacterium]
MHWKARAIYYFPLVVVLLLLSGWLEATDWRRPSRSIEIPPRSGIAVPVGRELNSVSYTPHNDGKITFLRRFQAEQGYIGLTARARRDQPFIGLEVTSVEARSPAHKAGLLAGDRILSANEEKLSNPARFAYLVQYHDFDTPMQLVLEREGQILDVELEVARVSVEEVDVEQVEVPLIDDHRHSGATFGSLTGQARKYFFEGEETGVILLGIDPGSPFFYSRLRQGDLIIAIDAKPVAGLEEVASIMRDAAEGGRRLEIAAMRSTRTFTSSVKPVRNLLREVSFNIPLVFEWEKNAESTSVEIGMGLIFDYHRSAYYSSNGEPYVSRGWSLPLNLIEYKNTGSRRRFTLLWFISFKW